MVGRRGVAEVLGRQTWRGTWQASRHGRGCWGGGSLGCQSAGAADVAGNVAGQAAAHIALWCCLADGVHSCVLLVRMVRAIHMPHTLHAATAASCIPCSRLRCCFLGHWQCQVFGKLVVVRGDGGWWKTSASRTWQSSSTSAGATVSVWCSNTHSLWPAVRH